MRLLHRCLTRTLSNNDELLAHKVRLETNLLRTELELEETTALVSSLLAGQSPAVNTDENIDGSTAAVAAAASTNDPQTHRVSWDRRSSLDNSGSTGSSTEHQGARPTAGVPVNGNDCDHGESSLDGPPVKIYSSGSSSGSSGNLASNPAVLSAVAEGSAEGNRGSGESEASWSSLQDVAGLATFKALVAKHEASQARPDRGRDGRIAPSRLACSAAAASAPNVDRSSPSKPSTMVGTALRDAESSGGELALRRFGSTSSGSSACGSFSGSPRIITSAAPAAALGIEMSYTLPATAKNPPSGRGRSADTRSTTAPVRKGLPEERGLQPRNAAVVPAARSMKPVGHEAKPAETGDARARTCRQSVPATLTGRDLVSSTGAPHGLGLLRGYPPATRWAARTFAAAAPCPATGCYSQRRVHAARGRRKPAVMGPKTTPTLEELDRTRRAIKKDMSDRLSAVTTEHMAATAAVARSSVSTAACKARNHRRQAIRGADILSALPLLGGVGRQGARRPLSSLQINAGERMRDFLDRFPTSHGRGSMGAGMQGSASTTVVAERGRKIRVAMPSGLVRVASTTRYDSCLDCDQKLH